jgi:Concanavalin A-like lectin/glucanases superfamily
MGRDRLPVVLVAVVGALALPTSAHAAVSYSDSVLANGPLSYLRFNEAAGAGVAQDASPNDRDGVPAGDVTFGVAGPFTDAGTALRLGKPGTLAAPVPASSRSVELWVNPDRPRKGEQAGIVSYGDPATDGWALGIGSKRKLTWKSGAANVRTTITLGSGVWTALTVTWDGSKVRIYRNGTLAKSYNASTVPAADDGDVVVGGNGAGAFTPGAFSGKVDELAIYSQVLSASDVAGHFGAARVPVNTAAPSISGAATPAVGDTLTAQPGTWTGAGDPTVYPRSYQWQRCDAVGDVCADVAGATSTTFALAAEDECSTFQVVETVANTYGSVTAISDPTGLVDPCDPATDVPAPLNEAPPTIDGTPAVGQTLTVLAGGWEYAEGAPSYQWRRCDGAGAGCTDVAGATATTYPLVAGDECDTFRVVESSSNATGSDSASSDATGVVAPCGTDPGTGGTDGTGGGTGTGAGTTTTTVPGVSQSTPPAGCLKLVAGRRTAKLRRLGTLRLAVAANACVTGPVRASFKTRKGLRLRAVRYSLDGKRLKRAKRPSYVAHLRFAAGTHTLSVRVTPRAGNAKSVKLRLRLAVA